MKKLIAGALLMGASTLAFAQPGCGVGAMERTILPPTNH